MPKTVKDTACLADLEQRISSTDRAPAAPLREAKLTKHYGFSRPPMREVPQRLTGAGCTTQQDSRGTKVPSRDIAGLRTCFQTAPLIYATIARFAAAHRTTDHLRALQNPRSRFFDAITAQDAEAATDLTLQHWDVSQGGLERFARPDPLPLDFERTKDAV